VSLTDDIRTACARVAHAARSVRIARDEVLEPYARALPAEPLPVPDLEPGASNEARAAFSLTLNAVNFGSGWFPTLRKPDGLSGYRTVEAALRARGPWDARALARIELDEVAEAFGQDRNHELMTHFTLALQELGARVRDEAGGAYLTLARSGEGSAVALVQRLATWPTWQDVSFYDREPVPFFKRAQIAAADLALIGLAPAGDLSELTLFADNLVPHVLRLDGILEVDPALVARIEREELLEHGSPEEVELRACALHAVERLVELHGATSAVTVDHVLWNRGAEPRYKGVPRHRARGTAY